MEFNSEESKNTMTTQYKTTKYASYMFQNGSLYKEVEGSYQHILKTVNCTDVEQAIEAWLNI